MHRVAKYTGLGALASASAGAGYFAARVALSVPKTGGRLRLECLDGEVEVLFDRAGIPHIYAGSTRDAQRALGYVMAQDRMVQMQTMLRVARGELSEYVGAMGVEMDRFMRTVGLQRAAAGFREGLAPDSLAALEAFCAGVNAYISRRSLRLPFEFLFMGGRPEPWTADDCLTIGLFTMWLLDSFWPADLVREKLVRALGRERAMQLLPETAEYNNPPVKVDGPGVSAETLAPGEEIDWGFETEGGGAEWIAASASKAFGSNNWALSGSRTTTGEPILACDPHIQHNAPGVLYLCHMVSPDLDVIGASFPGVPVIAYGHNGFCGWGATSLCPDVQDLYVETFESEDSDRYLFNGEWLEPEVILDDVKVRFAKPRRLKVVITRHGPVIRRRGNKGLALRWVGREAHLDSLGALLRQQRSRSWDEFVAAMEDYVGPAMNQVYADRDGNIGYLAAAKVPVRSSGDGTIPYDGSAGEGEWLGYVPFERMPRALNPEEGFFATANSKIVSDGYPELITKAWEAPYRNARISELLRSRERFSPDDMAWIHGDAFTHPGNAFRGAVLVAARGADLAPRLREAVELLDGWDCQARADSPAMTVYFYAWQRLRDRLLRHRLGSTLAGEYVCGWTTPNLALEKILEARDTYWLPTASGSYDSVVLEALEEALEELEGVFGTTEMSQWRWGRVHHLTCQHLLGLFWPLDRILNVGPAPRDGEGDTVNASPPASDCLTQLLSRGTMGGCSDVPVLPDCESHAAYAGPVLRMVLDFSDLDNSMAVLDVGQSGHRMSPHYKDHFPVWLKVGYFPLPYSREKVEGSATSRLRISP